MSTRSCDVEFVVLGDLALVTGSTGLRYEFSSFSLLPEDDSHTMEKAVTSSKQSICALLPFH